jgi:hypothetical protein
MKGERSCREETEPAPWAWALQEEEWGAAWLREEDKVAASAMAAVEGMDGVGRLAAVEEGDGVDHSSPGNCLRVAGPVGEGQAYLMKTPGQQRMS